MRSGDKIVQWTQSVMALCYGAPFCKLGHLMFKVSQFGDVRAVIGGMWWLFN